MSEKLNPIAEAQKYAARLREESRITQIKVIDNGMIENEARMTRKVILVSAEASHENCGLIHMHCMSSPWGRCNKKMAHGVDARESIHICNMCGQTFGR